MNNRGYMVDLSCVLKNKVGNSIFKTVLTFDEDIDDKWKGSIECGVSLFMDHYKKYNREFIEVHFDYMRYFPVDTTHSIVLYGTVMVLSNLLEYDPSQIISFDEQTGDVIIKIQ